MAAPGFEGDLGWVDSGGCALIYETVGQRLELGTCLLLLGIGAAADSLAWGLAAWLLWRARGGGRGQAPSVHPDPPLLPQVQQGGLGGGGRSSVLRALRIPQQTNLGRAGFISEIRKHVGHASFSWVTRGNRK